MTTTLKVPYADITSVEDLAPLIADANQAYYDAIGTGDGMATVYYDRLAARAQVLVDLYRRAAALAPDGSVARLAADIAVVYWRREATAETDVVAAPRRRSA